MLKYFRQAQNAKNFSSKILLDEFRTNEFLRDDKNFSHELFRIEINANENKANYGSSRELYFTLYTMPYCLACTFVYVLFCMYERKVDDTL